MAAAGVHEADLPQGGAEQHQVLPQQADVAWGGGGVAGQGEGQVGLPIRRATHVVQGDDVGVHDPTRQHGLALEPGVEAPPLALEDLQGHLEAQGLVLDPPHRARSAGAQQGALRRRPEPIAAGKLGQRLIS